MKKCILVFLVSLFPLGGLGGLFGVGLSAQVINKTIYNCAAFTIPEAAAASPAPSAYRWFENGTEIEGATTTTYTIVKDKAAGTYTYVRQAFSSSCQLWQSSNAYTVAVLASGTPGQPTIPTGAGVNTCPSTYVTISTTATGSAASYVWYKGGVAAATTTGLTYDVSSVGTFTWTVAGVNGCGEMGSESAGKQVTVAACCSGEGSAVGTGCCSGLINVAGICRSQTESGASTFTGCSNSQGGTLQIKAADAGTSTWPSSLCPSGWRVPTRTELSCMCTNKAVVGGFTSSYYWSSEEYSSGNAWYRNFLSCGEGNSNNSNYSYVRCVR